MPIIKVKTAAMGAKTNVPSKTASGQIIFSDDDWAILGRCSVQELEAKIAYAQTLLKVLRTGDVFNFSPAHRSAVIDYIRYQVEAINLLINHKRSQ